MDLKALIKETSIKTDTSLEFAKDAAFSLITKNICSERLKLADSLEDIITSLKEEVDELFSFELDQLKSKDFESFVLKIIYLYDCFSLFSNDQVVLRFCSLGIQARYLKWFIPIAKILEEIDKINQSAEIKIKIIPTLYFIRIHLIFKISNDIHSWAGMQSQKRKNDLIYNETHNRLFDTLRKIDYAEKTGKKLKKGSAEKMISESFKEVSEIGPDQVKYDVLQSAQGKTEKSTLSKIIEECTYYTCSERKMYCAMFELFRLLLPDGSLLTNDEFMGSSYSLKYGASYETYQHNKLKKLLSSTSRKYSSGAA